jgi:4-amino-4-deoxy-L-arabinose transferase-like glycosyltransferase
MLSKYTMAFVVVALVASLLLTEARRYLFSRWALLGAAIAAAVFLPNLIWQAQHGFISLEFLRHIHERDVRIGRADGFLLAQLTMTAQVVAAAGLYFFFSRHGRGFRPIGWMYVVLLALFVVARGRHYYLFPAYPMLYAGGAVWSDAWAGAVTRRVAWAIMMVAIVAITALFVPLAPVNTAWWRVANSVQETYQSEFGWPELVSEVARIRDTLPAEERAGLGVLAGSYGEAGAVNLYGPQYGLPHAISGINSMWERGYGDPPPRTLIVVGLSPQYAQENLAGCRAAGRIWNRDHVENEETTRAPVIYVCGPPRQGWPAFWKKFRYFG